MIVAIHQPEYLPWLGFLDKARRADVLVLLDDVQFNRDSLQHRAKIASGRRDRAFAWLTIPFVHRHPQRICDVQVADPAWAERHRALLRTVYHGAPGFAAAWPALDELLANPPPTVAAIATASLQILLHAFGAIPPRQVTSSTVGGEGARGDRVLDLCQRLGATRYLSGQSGAAYLDQAAFEQAGIAIDVQSFSMPLYRDGQPNVRGLSALDAWMWLGDKATEVFRPC